MPGMFVPVRNRFVKIQGSGLKRFISTAKKSIVDIIPKSVVVGGNVVQPHSLGNIRFNVATKPKNIKLKF